MARNSKYFVCARHRVINNLEDRWTFAGLLESKSTMYYGVLVKRFMTGDKPHSKPDRQEGEGSGYFQAFPVGRFFLQKYGQADIKMDGWMHMEYGVRSTATIRSTYIHICFVNRREPCPMSAPLDHVSTPVYFWQTIQAPNFPRQRIGNASHCPQAPTDGGDLSGTRTRTICLWLCAWQSEAMDA